MRERRRERGERKGEGEGLFRGEGRYECERVVGICGVECHGEGAMQRKSSRNLHGIP